MRSCYLSCVIAIVVYSSLPAISPALAVSLVTVGNTGTIRQSADSGGNWFVRSSGTTVDLNAVDCISTNCWIVGTGGTILRSTDAGITWAPQVSGTELRLLDVDFLNANIGWAVGDSATILKTVNGGETWVPQVSNGGSEYRAISAISPSKVWISGANGTIRHTIDGGTNWSFQTSGGNGLIEDIHFNSANDGVYVVGAGGVVATTIDGGANWNPANNNDPSMRAIRAVDFVDPLHGWFTGDQGVVGYTIDGGLTWERSTGVGTNAGFTDIEMINQQRGWVVGVLGIIRTTQNGGRNWSGQASGTDQTLLDIAAFYPPQYPDFDGDGDVDGRDFLTWQRNYGIIEGGLFAQGDSTGDGRVDGDDLAEWSQRYGTQPANIAGVPEPRSGLLIGSIMLCSLLRLPAFARSMTCLP